MITALILWFVLTYAVGFSWRPDSETFRRGMSFAARAYGTCLLSFLVVRANVFVLGLWYDKDVLGQYAIASQMFDFLNLIPASVALVLFPRLVQGAQNRWRLMVKGAWMTLAFMSFVCAGTAIVAREAVILVFGPSFEAAVPIIWCMLPAVLFCSTTTIVSQYLGASGYPREVLGIWVIALAVELILAYFLVPRFAGIGASVALTFAFVVSLVLSLRLAWSIQRQSVIEQPTQVARRMAA
jgi:O-antigen/teichoic acid export membrane protein